MHGSRSVPRKVGVSPVKRLVDWLRSAVASVRAASAAQPTSTPEVVGRPENESSGEREYAEAQEQSSERINWVWRKTWRW